MTRRGFRNPLARSVLAAVAAATACAAPSPAPAADWPMFRGPTRDGVAPAGESAPLAWSTTKNVKWKAALWGSIVRVGDRLYVTSRKGTTYVFAADRTAFKQLARNELGEPSNSTPAVSDGQLFIRTEQHLWCIGEWRKRVSHE